MFKENDYIMYKKDVCKVKDIMKNSADSCDYYILVPIDDESLTIKVPVDNRMGYLRKVITKKQAEDIISTIKDVPPLGDINEKNIESIYKDLIYNGNQTDLIKIIKTSYLRNENRKNAKRKVSEKDTKYFELAEKYLYNELSIALNKTFTETKEYIIRSIEQK